MTTRTLPALSLVVASSLLGVSSAAFASGFQLFEGNASSVTNFGAGGAAIAEDASTSYYNPAGLTRINQTQFLFSVIGVSFDTEFTGTSVWRNIDQSTPDYTQTGTVKGGKFTPVPAMHFAMPINEKLFAGVSVTAPFGLATEYDADSFVRYAATKTKLVTIDVSPAVGYKVNDTISIGAGLDWQYAKVEFNSVGGIPDFSDPLFFDSTSENSGHDSAIGWHGGVLLAFNHDATRVGFNYQSQVNHTVHGTSELHGELANGLTGGTQVSDDLNGRFHLPSTATLSVFHKIDPTWSVMGSVLRTNWSVFKQIQLNNVAGVNADTFEPDNTVVVTSNQNYRDTWRFVAGVDHHYNAKLLLRAGVGYDQSPVNNRDRDIRLPDGDRVAVSMGMSYQITPKIAFDLGYTHLFVKDKDINNSLANGNSVTTGSPAGTNTITQSVDVIGRSRTSANLVGAQLKVAL